MFNKILIANRGEIALRVIRACRELGISSVAVYSQADADSLHVKFADEAVCIGPPRAADSYLNIPRIISAAAITNADAIHPGYGFLAENAQFVNMCLESDISFIGPSSQTISQMGDKAYARKTMTAAGVPILPGSKGLIENEKKAVALASKVGYPIILKATAGGGGKGMRVVRSEDELSRSYAMAHVEAEMAFGNGGLYLERFLENPRHIEIQIMGYTDGDAITLGERDCSIQRRHQKLVEESPSPAVSPELRRQLSETAIKAAKAVGYIGAGTVEFLFDKGEFFFMEMNTRIQVEHPISEMVYSVDLVKEQIRAVAGERTLKGELKPRGHAIECRINAEDPDRNFTPSPGLITTCHIPGSIGVRVDTHAYAGYIIPPYYDSLIGKLIAFGNDRNEAINRMERALEEFVIEGIATTVPLHKKIVRDKQFIAGDYDTTFLERYL
ncbi:MAG: acetyl-CoA carboxylase biotin carboxylase subunit [Candidatus Hatepunaea meridiana]|nr:acetyl-CoA carboxylase biotin carboxylase subunit [Candidatus Hatepunaea meridiana]